MLRIKVAMALFLASLTACSATLEKEVPKTVLIPVAEKCVQPTVRSAGERPQLPIELVTDTTQIDQDVNLWKAAVARLLGYVGSLETERNDLASGLSICVTGGS